MLIKRDLFLLNAALAKKQKNKKKKKPVPVPLCPPQIPHDLLF
jgi:hypothetical protein